MSAKFDGAGVTGPLAWNPIVTDAPEASALLHVGAVAVTVEPVWLTVAFQPPWTVTPDGRVQVAVQGLTAAVPVLVIVTDAT